MASLRRASSSAVPNSICGLRLSAAYVSLRRLTKSTSMPKILTVAVSRCLDRSGVGRHLVQTANVVGLDAVLLRVLGHHAELAHLLGEGGTRSWS